MERAQGCFNEALLEEALAFCSSCSCSLSSFEAIFSAAVRLRAKLEMPSSCPSMSIRQPSCWICSRLKTNYSAHYTSFLPSLATTGPLASGNMYISLPARWRVGLGSCNVHESLLQESNIPANERNTDPQFRERAAHGYKGCRSRKYTINIQWVDSHTWGCDLLRLRFFCIAVNGPMSSTV